LFVVFDPVAAWCGLAPAPIDGAARGGAIFAYPVRAFSVAFDLDQQSAE
jgi:hypothetical protein